MKSIKIEDFVCVGRHEKYLMKFDDRQKLHGNFCGPLKSKAFQLETLIGEDEKESFR